MILTTIATPSLIHQTLAGRCRQLNIAAWPADPTGNLLTNPTEPCAPGVVLASGALRDLVQSAALTCARRDNANATASPITLFPGCTLLPLFECHGARRLSLTLAMIFTDPLIASHQFQSICASSSLDSEEFATVITPVLHPTASLEHSLNILRWMHEDLVHRNQDQLALEQFTDRLAQAYEENTLLFRLARFFNNPGSPAALLETVCLQLQQTLPFDWIAAYFRPDFTHCEELSDRLFISGALPCDKSLLHHLAAPQLQDITTATTILLNSNCNPLAAAVNAQIILQPITHDHRVVGALLAGNKQGSDPDAASFETQFLAAAANFLSIFHENVARFAEQRALFLGTLRALAASIDAKDPYTSGHSERVGLLASMMATSLNFDAATIEQYRIAGLVHDVGKIGVPEAVLTKQGRLTAEEIAHMQRHPEIGYRILKDIPLLKDVLPGVLHHHERFDGFGYPHGLAADNIPLIARVLALADTFDAMSSTRSYRPALSRQTVLDEIRRCGNTQFDPALVPVFLSLSFEPVDQLLAHHRARQAA